MFGIECQRSEENVQFYFDDPEAARYVWKLAVLQVRNSLFFLLPEIRGRIRKFPNFWRGPSIHLWKFFFFYFELI